MRTRWIYLIILFVFILASCSTAQPAKENDTVAPLISLTTPTEEAEPNLHETPVLLGKTTDTPEMPSTIPPIEKFIDLSKKDLANRQQIAVEKITLAKTEEILWPNAALGCPAPGKVYAQGKVSGLKIWLEAEGIEYIYHADFAGQIILCPELNPDNPDSFLSVTPGSTQGPNIGVPIK
jgi:hypothetical protein